MHLISLLMMWLVGVVYVVGCLFGLYIVGFAYSLLSCLVGCFVDLLVGWFACLIVCLLVCFFIYHAYFSTKGCFFILQSIALLSSKRYCKIAQIVRNFLFQLFLYLVKPRNETCRWHNIKGSCIES